VTAVSSLRTMGATRVPRSSIDLNIFSCGSAGDTHLESNTGKTADDFIHIQDPLCDGFGIADEQRTCPSPKLDRWNRVDFSISYREQSTDMPEFLLRLVRLAWLFARGQQALVLENIALRQQWAVFQRHRKCPRLNRSDRVFWIVLAKFWKNWRRALIIVHPDTVVRGQRQRFRGIGRIRRASRGKGLAVRQ
jgi:hypothetical protein